MRHKASIQFAGGIAAATLCGLAVLFWLISHDNLRTAELINWPEGTEEIRIFVCEGNVAFQHLPRTSVAFLVGGDRSQDFHWAGFRFSKWPLYENGNPTLFRGLSTELDVPLWFVALLFAGIATLLFWRARKNGRNIGRQEDRVHLMPGK